MSTKRKMKNSATETSIPMNDAAQKSENKDTKTKRCRFTYQEKAEILEDLQNESVQSVSQKHGINERTLRKWKKNKATIVSTSNNTHQRTSKKISQNSDLDNAIYVWLLDAQAKGVPVTGPILRQKALCLNQVLGGSKDFRASEGWLDKWKKRKGVRTLTITGEKLSANEDAAEIYKNNFKKMLATKQLSRPQIFNFDETSLQYKVVPKKTLAPKNVCQVSGTKKQLERVTIAACCNADGSLKLPLLFVGKSKNPRCLTEYNKKNLPVYYRNQKNAWVDKTIFEEWFAQEFVPRVENFLKAKNLPLKAVLLIDNCRSHKYIKIRNIEVAFFPPNVTSIIQPLDQGILQTLKLNYQYYLANSILNAQENNITLIDHLKAINIRQVIFWVAEAWKDMKPSTIYKCWKKLWPIEKREIATQTEELLVNLSLLDGSVSAESISNLQIEHSHITDLLTLIQSIKDYETVNEETLVEWLKIPAKEILSDQEIIQHIRGNHEHDDVSVLNKNLENDANVLNQNFENNLNFLSESFNILYNEK